jgi:hypothetical protein
LLELLLCELLALLREDEGVADEALDRDEEREELLPVSELTRVLGVFPSEAELLRVLELLAVSLFLLELCRVVAASRELVLRGLIPSRDELTREEVDL